MGAAIGVGHQMERKMNEYSLDEAIEIASEFLTIKIEFMRKNIKNGSSKSLIVDGFHSNRNWQISDDVNLPYWHQYFGLSFRKYKC